jgi:hypothetical protein
MIDPEGCTRSEQCRGVHSRIDECEGDTWDLDSLTWRNDHQLEQDNDRTQHIQQRARDRSVLYDLFNGERLDVIGGPPGKEIISKIKCYDQQQHDQGGVERPGCRDLDVLIEQHKDRKDKEDDER